MRICIHLLPWCFSICWFNFFWVIFRSSVTRSFSCSSFNFLGNSHTVEIYSNSMRELLCLCTLTNLSFSKLYCCIKKHGIPFHIFFPTFSVPVIRYTNIMSRRKCAFDPYNFWHVAFYLSQEITTLWCLKKQVCLL